MSTWSEYIFEVKWRDGTTTNVTINAQSLKDATHKFKDAYGWYSDAKYNSYKIINKEYRMYG